MKKMEWLGVAVFLATAVSLAVLTKQHHEHAAVVREEWKQTACPSLLSGDRTFRDTLITMKMISECNAYVMETFK